LDLASPISAATHTLYFHPTANLASDERPDIDWLELHDAGGTPASPKDTRGTPGTRTGLSGACDVVLHPGLNTLQTAHDNVPASILTNDYVICMYAGTGGVRWP
jgi:hypothetical protein